MSYLLGVMLCSAMVGAIMLSVGVLLEICLGVDTSRIQTCAMTLILVSMILLMTGLLVYVISKALGA